MPETAGPGEGLIRTYDLLEHLIDDIHTAFETLESDKASHYLRRCAARAVFSFIEGLVQILKVELRSAVRLGHCSIQLTAKEEDFLNEIRTVDGEAIPVRIPLDINLKKTFRLAARVWSLSEYTFNTDGDNYQDFLAAKDARNRLTHPRTYYDITVTDGDMHCYSISYLWIKRQFAALMRLRVNSIESMLPEDVREQLHQRQCL